MLASAVQHVRVDDATGAIDAEFQWLSDHCSSEYEVVTDYSSARISATGEVEPCSAWTTRIGTAAIRLLQEDALCTGETVEAPDTPPNQSLTPAGSIDWSTAANHAGTRQQVCGPLASQGDDHRGDVFLNLGRAYPDPSRFQIVIWDVGTVETVTHGTLVCTTGTITMYGTVAQIELSDPSQVKIAD